MIRKYENWHANALAQTIEEQVLKDLVPSVTDEVLNHLANEEETSQLDVLKSYANYIRDEYKKDIINGLSGKLGDIAGEAIKPLLDKFLDSFNYYSPIRRYPGPGAPAPGPTNITWPSNRD